MHPGGWPPWSGSIHGRFPSTLWTSEGMFKWAHPRRHAGQGRVYMFLFCYNSTKSKLVDIFDLGFEIFNVPFHLRLRRWKKRTAKNFSSVEITVSIKQLAFLIWSYGKWRARSEVWLPQHCSGTQSYQFLKGIVLAGCAFWFHQLSIMISQFRVDPRFLSFQLLGLKRWWL